MQKGAGSVDGCPEIQSAGLNVFLVGLTDEANPITMELRNNLLLLCKFIRQQIVKTMISPSPELLTPIIETNPQSGPRTSGRRHPAQL